MRLILALVLVSLLPSSGALAWGADGHRTVAAIAERYLSATARRQVQQLLANEPPGRGNLIEASTWPDDIRREQPATGPLHYVNVPIGAGHYDPAVHCPAGRCSVAALARFTATLRDRRALPAARSEALKWVVHLVGDMHQPLHAGDNGDRGGNDVKVRLGSRDTNLHAVWDTAVVEALGPPGGQLLAAVLLKTANPKHLAAWSKQGSLQWTAESVGIARGFIYMQLGAVPGPVPQPIVLAASYPADAAPIVRLQLLRAGIRLAAVLNATLR